MRGRRATVVLAATSVVLAATVAVAVSSAGADDPEPPDGGRAERATATVTRGDLVQSATTTGTSQYGGRRRLTTSLAGTITALAKEGAVVEEGEVLLEVDRTPVVRLDGKVPAWRDLGPGVSEDADVEQLERALRDLGHPGASTLEVDGTWTWATTIAVQQWQRARGLPETGRLPLGSVVFTARDLRVTSRVAAIGDRVQPGAEVLAVSDERRLVTTTLETSQRSLARLGAVVRLELADGARTRGKVTSVRVVPAADEKSDESLSVTVEAVDEDGEDKVARQLDGAAVQVTFRQVLARKVLLVPVSALVAVSGGDHAVERVSRSGTRLVRVTLGAFGDTSVAVRGALREGDTVVVTP